MRLGDIAERLECSLEGDGDIEVTGIATLEAASEGEISFLTNMKYYAKAKTTRASAVLVDYDCPPISAALLKHKNPYLAFAKAIEVFHTPRPKKASIHPTAWVAETAVLGEEVSIGAYSFVGPGVILGDRVDIRERCNIHERARIGEGTLIHSGSVVREAVSIGSRCIIQNNAVIGSDGFGFAKQEDRT